MKKLKKVTFAVLFFLFGLPSVAFAASGGATQALIGDVLDVVSYGLVALGVALVVRLATWVMAKFKVSISQSWLDSIDGYLDKAIHYADEWAKNKIAANATITGNDKLNVATEFLLKLVGDDKRLVSMAEDQIKKLIEARLGQHRADTITLAGSVEPKMLTMHEDGTVKLHMTDGSELHITDMLASAGFVKAPKVDTAKAPSAQAGFANYGTMIVLALAGIIALVFVACTWSQVKQDGKQAGADAVKCIVPDLFDRATEVAPSLESNILAAVDPSTGKVNWSQAKSSLSGLKSDVFGCALAIAIREIQHIGLGTGAQPIQVDQQSLTDGYNTIRNAQFSGKTFIIEAN